MPALPPEGPRWLPTSTYHTQAAAAAAAAAAALVVAVRL